MLKQIYAITNEVLEPITFVLAYPTVFLSFFLLFVLIQSQYLINTLKPFHGVGVSHNIALFSLSHICPPSCIITHTYNYRVFIHTSIFFTLFTLFVLTLIFPYYSFTYFLFHVSYIPVLPSASLFS